MVSVYVSRACTVCLCFAFCTTSTVTALMQEHAICKCENVKNQVFL